jgi:histone H2A
MAPSTTAARSGRKGGERKSKSARAGVLFSVPRFHRYIKKSTPKSRVTMGAAVYTAAVIEYLTAEVLELSGNAAKDHKKQRINARHIFLAVSIDEELKKLLNGVTIPQGGVLPHINSFLFKSKSSSDDQSQTAPKPKVSRTNTAPIARAPSALATKAASTAASKTSSKEVSFKKTASVAGGTAATSA